MARKSVMQFGIALALAAVLTLGAQAKEQVTITYAGGWGQVDGEAGASKGAMMKALLADFEKKTLISKSSGPIIAIT